MDITIKKAKTIGRTFVIWCIISLLMLAVFSLLHFGLYFVIAAGKKTIAEHFSNFWVLLAFYSFLFPASIAFSYRSKAIEVIHNGEVNPYLVREYFLGRKFCLISEQQGLIVMESLKWWERFFSGSKSVRIKYQENSIIIEMPERYMYDVHHGFKFGRSFHT